VPELDVRAFASRTNRRFGVRIRLDPPLLVLYGSYMSEMTVSAAREGFAGAIERARRSGELVYVTRRGHRLAVIVDADAYDGLVEAAEHTIDRAELSAARSEDDYVPWDEVKADLGLR
jgi:prevent-host-death family protein